MILTPYEWQLEDAHRLATQRRWLLANEMRTGKTGSAILAALEVRAKHVLVICPAIVVTEWWRAIGAFGGAGKAMWEVYSYDKFTRSHLIGDCSAADTLILDECHYLKTPDAKRTEACYGDGHQLKGMLHVERIWGLSGTPAPNHAGEYWTHARAFGHTTLSYWQFLNHFCIVVPTQFGYRVTGNRRDTLPELRNLLAKFVSRRTQRSVWKLTPEPFWSVRTMTPTKADATALAEIDATLSSDKPGDMSKERRLLGLLKVPYAVEHIVDLLGMNAVPKVLVGAWHTDVIDRLRVGLTKYSPIVIDGDTPDKMRWELLDRFQTAPSCRVAIVQKKAGGVGISAKAAEHVVDVEPDWGTDVDEQFYQRPQHIERTTPLPVDRIAMAGTLDETILRSQTRKRRMKDEIEETGAHAPGAMDEPSLDSLLGVGASASIFLDDL